MVSNFLNKQDVLPRQLLLDNSIGEQWPHMGRPPIASQPRGYSLPLHKPTAANPTQSSIKSYQVLPWQSLQYLTIQYFNHFQSMKQCRSVSLQPHRCHKVDKSQDGSVPSESRQERFFWDTSKPHGSVNIHSELRVKSVQTIRLDTMCTEAQFWASLSLDAT